MENNLINELCRIVGELMYLRDNCNDWILKEKYRNKIEAVDELFKLFPGEECVLFSDKEKNEFMHKLKGKEVYHPDYGFGKIAKAKLSLNKQIKIKFDNYDDIKEFDYKSGYVPTELMSEGFLSLLKKFEKQRNNEEK